MLIVGAVGIAFLAVILVATLYDTPTCTDGKQNQDESGVDCGGACQYLCRDDTLSPTVLFTQALQNGEGRTDVIAEVENKNASAAARAVPYTITLYGTDQSLIQQVTGTLDLPPAERVPVFVPGIASGKQPVASAFLDIGESAPKWFALQSDPRALPQVSTPVLGSSTTTPRIEAVLGNGSVAALTDVRVVVLVRNETGNVIAASQTILSSIPAQGSATAIFTWNEPFPEAPALIEVVPVIGLP